jgi:ABC-type bacteriocin/lantibiotic exporters, contain an N-terminal double-glycine peptidase domain
MRFHSCNYNFSFIAVLHIYTEYIYCYPNISSIFNNLIFSIVFDDNSTKIIKILPLVIIAIGFYILISVLIFTINSTAINAADTIIISLCAIIILSLSLYFAYAIKGIKEMNKNNDTYMSLMMCSEYKAEEEIKTLSGRITADNISIITADGMELLKNISLNISPNRLTLLQSNGICGKSLLLRAIKGDYIIKGKFLYDNYDYNEIRNSIQNNIYYTDKIELSSGTIRDNISLIHTDSEILRAANMTGLIEYISQHNGGLNYEIMDKNSISTTEAILIEMTRILIKKPPIALIDNITTPLSPALEKRSL